MNKRQQKFVTNLKPIIEILEQKQRLKKHEKDLLDYATKYVDNIESLNETEVKILVLLYDGFRAEIKAEQKILKAQEKEQIEKTKERKKNQRRAFLLGSALLKEADILDNNEVRNNEVLFSVARLVFLGLISDFDAIKYFGFTFSVEEIENKKFLTADHEKFGGNTNLHTDLKSLTDSLNKKDKITTKQKENIVQNFLDLLEKYS